MSNRARRRKTARLRDRVLIVGAHPWAGYAGVVDHVSPLNGGITVRLDCGLRATVSSPLYYRIVTLDTPQQPEAEP